MRCSTTSPWFDIDLEDKPTSWRIDARRGQWACHNEEEMPGPMGGRPCLRISNVTAKGYPLAFGACELAGSQAFASTGVSMG